MVLRIKTIREEFEAAEDSGYVYGEIRRQKIFFVYVELGIEEEYIALSNKLIAKCLAIAQMWGKEPMRIRDWSSP